MSSTATNHNRTADAQAVAAIFNAAETSRTFAGKFPLNGEPAIYAHFNPPELADDLNAKYSPARLLAGFIETDEAAYWEFLECMPPREMSGGSFTMCEATTLDIRFAFFQFGERYFGAYVRDASGSAHNWRAVRAFIAANLPAEG